MVRTFCDSIRYTRTVYELCSYQPCSNRPNVRYTLIEVAGFFWNVQIVDCFSTSRLYTGHQCVGLQ